MDNITEKEKELIAERLNWLGSNGEVQAGDNKYRWKFEHEHFYSYEFEENPDWSEIENDIASSCRPYQFHEKLHIPKVGDEIYTWTQMDGWIMHTNNKGVQVNFKVTDIQLGYEKTWCAHRHWVQIKIIPVSMEIRGKVNWTKKDEVACGPHER